MFKRCLLDLDGVLVDFVRGSCRLHNLKNPFLEGCQDFSYFKSAWGMTSAEFYQKMDRRFWSELDWTEDGMQIFNLVDEYIGYHNTCILTSPCSTFGCLEGKMDWIRANIPKLYQKNILIGSAKEFCASPDNVLIDDCDDNIDAFIAAGGHGITVPRPWNRQRDLQFGSLEIIRSQLNRGTSKNAG